MSHDVYNTHRCKAESSSGYCSLTDGICIGSEAATTFKHPVKPGTVTVPHPRKDLGVGLVKAIRKQAGI